jgi:hypothetical protein
VIVIEGSDNLGKTRASKRIAELTGWEYRHMNPPPDHWDYNLDVVKMVQIQTVQDRFHLGGLVYGHFLQCHPVVQLDLGRYRDLCINELRERGVLIVVMYAGDDAWYADHLEADPERDEMFSSVKRQAANAIFRGLPGIDFRYDVARDGYPDDYMLKCWIDTAVRMEEKLHGQSR